MPSASSESSLWATPGNGNSANHLEHDTDSTRNNQINHRHSPHLQGELNAHTANDYGFNKSEAHFNPGLARTNVAATPEHPQGTSQDDWNVKHKDLTVMQQHCVYWDADGDGIIWPQDTYNGCRAWGWNPILCAIAVFLINGNLSWPTGTSWLPDPFFRIHINRIHHDKHGSDSMTYDNQGRFRPHAFEEFFDNYDRGKKGGLNVGDLYQAWLGQRLVFDFFGWSAFFFEWLATYLLLWPEDGIMKKDDIRRMYDGSIFQFKADEYARKQKQAIKPYGR